MHMKKPAIPMSDEAVRRATGKTWAQWLSRLDKVGAKKMNHQEIVKVVAKMGAGSWWQQMVTVTYEQQRGLREKHQTASGFEVSVHRTLAKPVSTVYRAWTSPATRKKWLSTPITIRTARLNKALYFQWRGKSNADARFEKQSATKTRLAIQLRKLTDRTAVEKERVYWKKSFSKLERLLNG
jgi:hypothetical protein